MICYSVSGAGKTGKTNLLMTSALQLKEKNAKVYVFDGPLRELESFSSENKLDGYYTSLEDLFGFMEQVLVPQLSERNEIVFNTRESGGNVKEVLASYDRIVLLINDAVCFFNYIYDQDADMGEVLETVFQKGLDHKIHFMMAISPRDYQECYGYTALRLYTKDGIGLHLGGSFEEQGILDFSMSENDCVRKLSAGIAYAMGEQGTSLVVTPKLEEKN